MRFVLVIGHPNHHLSSILIYIYIQALLSTSGCVLNSKWLCYALLKLEIGNISAPVFLLCHPFCGQLSLPSMSPFFLYLSCRQAQVFMPIWRYVDDGDCIAVSDAESDDSSTSSRSVQSNGLRHAKLHFAPLSLLLVHFFSARRHPQA